MARKTIEVSTVKDHMNMILANSDDELSEYRVALAHALEWVLMDTGNYHGFRYLEWDPDTHEFGDMSRRYYY